MAINRKMIYFLLSTVATLILFGCTKIKHVTYHSTASIPHSVSSNLTVMKYIKLNESIFSRLRQKYGVATAVDFKDGTSQVSYVLFAPSNNSCCVEKLKDMLMSMSVPLTTDQAKMLSNKLKVLAGNWGKEMEEDGGIFYEFNITPEHEQKRLSENVILQRHVFKLTFSQFPKRKTAPSFTGLGEFLNIMKSETSVKLTIGRDHYFKTIKMDKKTNLQALIYLLDQAVKEIESQFGKEFKLPLKRDT